ncbi:uncharacterized protein [Diadema antillarum]|uniref:uncharacterized protein n=1 Tax=Diadema antillarum TaxID=105358 RepID=UPI003A85E323
MWFPKMAASTKKQPAVIYLPVTCQICLGKVRQPVICSNQHVFCNSCLEEWLRHRSVCPTCLIPITPDNPFKQILGGPSNADGSEQRRSAPELRKMRFDLLHREYEAELERLQKEVDRLRSRNRELEKNRQTKAPLPSPQCAPSSSTGDTGPSKGGKAADNSTADKGSAASSSKRNREDVMRLARRLKEIWHAYKHSERELRRVKQDNVRLRDSNSSYIREVSRLEQELGEMTPRRYKTYAQTAQLVRLNKSEQEVKQLERALERTDVYLEDLEHKLEQYREKYGELAPGSSSSTGKKSSCDHGNDGHEIEGGRKRGKSWRSHHCHAGIPSTSNGKSEDDDDDGASATRKGVARKLDFSDIIIQDTDDESEDNVSKTPVKRSSRQDSSDLPVAKKFYASKRGCFSSQAMSVGDVPGPSSSGSSPLNRKISNGRGCDAALEFENRSGSEHLYSRNQGGAGAISTSVTPGSGSFVSSVYFVHAGPSVQNNSSTAVPATELPGSSQKVAREKGGSSSGNPQRPLDTNACMHTPRQTAVLDDGPSLSRSTVQGHQQEPFGRNGVPQNEGRNNHQS